MSGAHSGSLPGGPNPGPLPAPIGIPGHIPSLSSTASPAMAPLKIVESRQASTDDDPPPPKPISLPGGPHPAIDPFPPFAELKNVTALDDTVSDSNTSKSSSIQGTPSKRKHAKASKKAYTAINGGDSVLSCQLALIAALTSDMQNSVNASGIDNEDWKMRVMQVNQVVQMAQYEARRRDYEITVVDDCA